MVPSFVLTIATVLPEIVKTKELDRSSTKTMPQYQNQRI